MASRASGIIKIESQGVGHDVHVHEIRQNHRIFYRNITIALAEHKLCQGHCIIALWLLNIYTLCPKKVYPLMFDNNFGKCGPIFKIFSPTDSGENFLCIYTKTSTSPAICCYTTSWNSKIQICWFWQHPQQTVDMFLRTLLWGLDLTFDSCETDCLETADTYWLTFWSLSDDVSNQQ